MKNKTRVLFRGNHLQLVDWNSWEYIERLGITGITVILAVTKDKKIILVEQFRAPLHSKVIELPAGLVGDIKGNEKEGLEEAAKRELFEETGYRCGEMNPLTEGPPSPGCTNEIITLLQAQDLEKEGPGGGDEAEDITVHEIPLEEARSWIESMRGKGFLIDPKIYMGLYFAER